MKAWWLVVGVVAGCGDVKGDKAIDAAPMPDHPGMTADAMPDALSCAAVPANQVAWWRGDQNAVDSSGNAYDATTHGASFSYTPGKHGFAFALNGSDQFLTVSENDALWPADSFSLETWIKTAATGGDILIKYQCGGNCPSNVSQAYFGLALGAGKPYFEFRTDADPTIFQLTTTLKTVNDSQWHHIVGVRDVTAMQALLYVDGQLEATSNLSGNQLTAMTNSDGEVDPVIIGAGETGGTTTYNAFFAGAVDDMAVYHTALSPSQVSALYTAPDGKCN